MKKFSRILAMTLVLAMCMSLFAGCSLFEKEPEATDPATTEPLVTEAPKPKTAAELLAYSKDAMQTTGENYNMLMTLIMDISMNMEMMGMTMDMDIPMNIVMDMDIAGTSMHGDMTMKADMKAVVEYEGEKETQEETIDESAEMYVVVVDGKTTTYMNDGEQWIVSEEEVNKSMSDLETMAPEDLFKNAEMSQDGDNYIVKIKFSDLMANEKFKEAMSGAMQSTAEAGTGDMFGEMDADSVMKMFGDAAMTYKFDSEYRLVEMSTGRMELDVTALMDEETMAESGMDADSLSMAMDLNIKLDKFGEIKEDDVKVPDEVKENAITEDELMEDWEDWEDWEDEEVIVLDPIAPVDPSALSDDWKDLDIAIDGVVYQFPYDYDKLVENGWAMDLAEYGYEDGYVLNKDDQTYSTISLYNERYGGNSWSAFSIWCGFENFADKVQDITECDLWSIQLDIMDGWEPFVNYPTVQIAKGITFGSTKEDVIAAFGEPDDIYEATEYGYVVYDYSNDYKECMSLTIYDDYGVTCIDLSRYSD